MALKYYHRISNFAKEMLVQPEVITVKKNQDIHFRPSVSSKHFYSGSDTFKKQQPMLFGSPRSGAERVVDSIKKNLNLDTSPSKRFLMGSDEAILNLRPNDPDKQVGRSGRFRHKAQSGTQRFLDRVSREFPLYLNPDLAQKKASTL